MPTKIINYYFKSKIIYNFIKLFSELIIKYFQIMTILGLDLGTNSLGWAVVENENNEIIDTGVRIFPEGVVAKTLGMGDKEQSKNATRRDKRQMRRQFYRKRLRKIKLLEVLIEQQMCPLSTEDLKRWKNWDRKEKTDGKVFPSNSQFVEWLKLNPYILREKALKDKLTLNELGRIFYHLIQRRGFLSNRKGKEDTAIFTKGKPDENILSINETKEKIKNSTLGSYLNSISFKENVPYKTIVDESGKEIRLRGRYTVRDMYIAEFEKIWNLQAELLGLNKKQIKVKKIREYKGSLVANRNKNRINYLREKFGKNNVEISETSKKGISKVITYSFMTLKEFLGGEIKEIENENGDKILNFKSNESILFWQRPLRSQKGLLSNCRFENDLPVIMGNGEFLKNSKGEIQKRSKKPCPISHPEFELFRSYQFINNIKYSKNPILTHEQRQVVLDLINSKENNFDFVEIPKKLKLTYEKFNYGDKQKVPGNITIKKLKPLFDKEIWEAHYEEIWHCFYFYDDDDKLYKKLEKDFAIKKDIETIKKIRLKEGYGNVSLKAIRNILPFLEKGYQFDRAVILGGVKNAFGKRWKYFEEFHDNIEKEIISILKEDNKEGEAIEKIKEHLASPVFNYGFTENDPWFTHLYHHSQEVEKKGELKDIVPEIENLRNPIVQQGIYETRRLVNTLIKKYKKERGSKFYFDRINIEMGRDLRNNKSQRQEMSFRINENNNKNNEARERLAEFGLQASRENIQKYLMFKEIEERAGKAQCPYTGKIISIANLLGRDNVIQIEHIFPFSVSLDDSFGNKTLCEANFNREKSEKTPYQFYKENPDPKLWGVSTWEAVEERAFRVLPYRKAKRFTTKREFEKSDFIERQLNDSRYIAKKAVEILSHVCKDVRVMPGQLTAELRHLWGLNNILQPAQQIDSQMFEVDEHNSIPYYVVTNEKGEALHVQRKLNQRPATNSNQILATGYVNNNKFSSKFFKIDMETPELQNGKYWAKLNITDKIKLIPKFINKPETDNDEIVFKGKIENGVFKNDTYGRVKTILEEGSYWAKFKILNTKFEEPQKDKQPKTKRNQILLFGNVINGQFKCFIYQCETNLEDGKYWIILDLNPDNIEFIRSVNPKPEIEQHQLLITATIDEQGLLVADIDKEYQVTTNKKSGKYYAVLEIESKEPELYNVENEPPKIEKGENILEGNTWVDKYTGEIKFDPKKNRDDHRHHAIDAITIALTEQGYLQRLSTYNAQRKEKQRQKLDSTEKFPEPWLGFDKDVKSAVNSILISHNKNDKTLTKNKKGFSVRGQLHKENVFGKRQAPNQEQAYHRRTKITELKNNKSVNKVVDITIRELILKHLKDNCGIDINNPKGFTVPKDAFYKEGNWQIFLPNKNGEPVPIKKVRKMENIGNATQLKSNINQFVNPRNNHHVLIYRDYDGNLKEDVVTFWTVVERKLQGSEIYQLPEDGQSVVEILETNGMFLLGLCQDEYESNKNNPVFLSKYLYKVEAVSSKYYEFRHHLESSQKREYVPYYYIISSLGIGIKGWQTFNPIKVTINVLGKIINI